MARKTVIIAITASSIASCSNTPTNNITIVPLGNMNYSWMSTYDSTTQKITYEANWVGSGWWYGDDAKKGKSANLSKYEQVVIEVDSIDEGIDKMGLSIEYTNNKATWIQVPVIDGRATLRATLEADYKKHVREIYLLGNHPGSIHLKNAYLRTKIEYTEPKMLKISDGFIDKKEFEGFSNKARLDFTYTTSGELTQTDTNGKTISMQNWAIGFLISIADTFHEKIPPRNIYITKTGLQTYSCYLDDIQYMLNITDSTTGQCGIKFVVWDLGNLKDVSTVCATISEEKYHN